MKIPSKLDINTEFALVAIFIAFLAGYLPTLRGLAERWLHFDEAYGHGLLIVAMFVYLALAARSRLVQAPVSPRPLALIPLVLLSLTWFIAYTASISIIQELLLPVLLIGAWLVVAGHSVTRCLLFPALLLYFAIPVWDFLNNVLIDLTVIVVRTLLPLWNITTLVEGSSVHLPAGTITVADGCSGLRYVVTGTALATIGAKLNFQSTHKRIAMIACGTMLSLLANWVRVLSLVLIGHYSQMQSPMLKSHDTYGWLLFLVILTPIFFAPWFFAPDRAPSTLSQEPGRGGQRVPIKALAFGIAALLAGPLIALVLASSPAATFALTVSPPLTWTQIDQDSRWVANLPPAYQLSQQSYRSGSEMLTASVYAYRRDAQHTKLLPYINSIYDKELWNQLAAETLPEKTPHAYIDVNQLVLKSSRGQSMHAVWFWFDVGGQATASYARAKLEQIRAQFGGKNYALVVVLDSPCKNNDCTAANERLRHFLADADLQSRVLVQQKEVSN
jgi:EpsI family protein